MHKTFLQTKRSKLFCHQVQLLTIYLLYLFIYSIYLSTRNTRKLSGCALASPPSRTSGGWSEAGGGAPAAPGQTRGQGDLGQSGDS